MNIFLLDYDIHKCARAMCDKHIVKMPTEYVQILSTVCRESGLPIGYKSTHVNHPCVKWAGESVDNYLFLYALAGAIGREYSFRYTGKIHKSIIMLYQHLPVMPAFLPDILQTPFPLCMPDKYKLDDPVESYRAYYRSEKKAFAAWTNRPVPKWFSTSEIF